MRAAFEIGLHPDEFWEMTIGDFLLCWEGYQRREADDMRKRAWEVCHVINLWARDPVTPAQLLGEDQPMPMFADGAEFRAYMAAKKAKAAEKRKAEAIARKKAANVRT